jgi:2-C-methyl-D-erythritol 4-phosphate cytidylyltransferase/2-C-methyl-D-erythritol 2,4-cyclodiphosphate synthase
LATRQDPEFVGIVVAAGSSTRFGGSTSKQFIDLDGRSVLERAVRAVADRPALSGVVVVLPPDELDGPWARRARSWPGVLAVVAGGITRSRSVMQGLAAAPRARFVLVHDAARPLAGAALIERVIEATRAHGAALPALEVADTVKEIDAAGMVAATLDRARLRLAQTPQGARSDWLRQALAAAEEAGVQVTDEAAALERAGHSVAVVSGDPRNLKITSAQDIDVLRDRIEESEMELRVGIGFDIHRFDPSRPLVLGGLRFEGEPGLAGHSDADVVLHAAMDALLGAAGLGDIGLHFPPDDPQYAGADSRGLAEEVTRLLGAQGVRIVNLDLMLLAERPKIRDHVEQMRETIAACFGIETARVGLKATTLEGLGALGRREGIACQAVASIRGGTDRK